MSESPRRTEVEEALSHVSEQARQSYTFPFTRTEYFYCGRTQKIGEFISPEVRELVEAGLLMIKVELNPVDYDDTYRSWKEIGERIKDLPLRQ